MLDSHTLPPSPRTNNRFGVRGSINKGKDKDATKGLLKELEVEVVLPEVFESLLKKGSLSFKLLEVKDFSALCTKVAEGLSPVQAFTDETLLERYFFSLQENDTELHPPDYSKLAEKKIAGGKNCKLYLRALGMRRGLQQAKDVCSPNKSLAVAEGWLKKLCPSNRLKMVLGRSIWQKRYFRLEEDHIKSRLMYAKQPHAYQFRFIHVMDIEHVAVLSVMKGYRFTITTRSGRSIMLMGYSPKEVSLWAMHIVALQEKIKKAVAERGSGGPRGSGGGGSGASVSTHHFRSHSHSTLMTPLSMDNRSKSDPRLVSASDYEPNHNRDSGDSLSEQLRKTMLERGLGEYVPKVLVECQMDLKDLAFVKEHEEDELCKTLGMTRLTSKMKFRRLLSECRQAWAKEISRQEGTQSQPAAVASSNQPTAAVDSNDWVEFEADGKFYYYNQTTKTTSWPVPGTDWRKFRDKESSRFFYRNRINYSSQWIPPPEIVAWQEKLKKSSSQPPKPSSIHTPRESSDFGNNSMPPAPPAGLDDSVSIRPGEPTRIRDREPSRSANSSEHQEALVLDKTPSRIDEENESDVDSKSPNKSVTDGSGLLSAPGLQRDRSAGGLDDYESDEDIATPAAPMALSDPASGIRACCKDKTGKLHYLDEEYDIKEEIELGRGISSVVKLAIKKGSQEEVAVKIVAKNQGSIDDEVFREEIRLLRKITHPNIISLLDVYESTEHMYIVVELAFGGELFDRILEFKKFNETQAKGIIRRVLSAIKHIHSFGIVHRDIKPENILFATNSVDAELKLSDFGFAKDLMNKGDALQAESKLGTKGYAAPEVWEGKKYDEKCDVWSLGILAYILLSGVPPFVETPEEGALNTPFWIYCNRMEGTPQRPLEFPFELWKGVSNDAVGFLKQCLQLDPQKRARSHELWEHPWLKESKKFNAGRRGSTTRTSVDSATHLSSQSRVHEERHKRGMSTFVAGSSRGGFN